MMLPVVIQKSNVRMQMKCFILHALQEAVQAKMLYAGVRIGAWASIGGGQLMVALAGPQTYRMPSQYTKDELEIRAKFTLIAKNLETTKDDFSEIRRIVDEQVR